MIVWTESGRTCTAQWRSENAAKAPQRVVVVDDTLNADTAYRLACEGTAMLWRGDFQNARQLLQAMRRRLDKKTAVKSDAVFPQAFHLYRQSQLQRARIMGMLLILFTLYFGAVVFWAGPRLYRLLRTRNGAAVGVGRCCR